MNNMRPLQFKHSERQSFFFAPHGAKAPVEVAIISCLVSLRAARTRSTMVPGGIKMPPLSALLFLTVAVSYAAGHCLPARAFDQAWQRICGKAYQEKIAGHYDRALADYKEALRLLPAGTPLEVAIDVELDVVDSLIECRRFDEAEQRLLKLKPLVSGVPLRGGLIEARYCRRAQQLARSSRNYACACAPQSRLVEILSDIFGAKSADALEEVCLLMQCFRESQKWNDAAAAASFLEQSLEGPLRPALRTHLQQELSWFFEYYAARAEQLIAQQKVQEGYKVLTRLSKFKGYSHRRFKLLENMLNKMPGSSNHFLQKSPQWKNLMPDSIIEVAMQIGIAEMSDNEKRTYASALFNRGLECMIVGTPTNACLQDLSRAVTLLESTMPDGLRSSNLLYIQADSSYARALALRDEIPKSESILDSLQPPPGAVSDLTALYGIFQARGALALAYKRQGNMQKAKDQFDAILALINRMNHLSNRKSQYEMWKRRRAKLPTTNSLDY